MSSEAIKPDNSEQTFTRRKFVAGLGATALGGLLLGNKTPDISTLPGSLGITSNAETGTKHERSQMPNSPLGAYNEGWRVIVPKSQNHPDGYSAFISSPSDFTSDDQSISYADGRFVEGTQTVPWNEEYHMLTLLPLHASQEDTSTSVTYGESDSGKITSTRTEKVELKVVPFRDNVFMESVNEHSQSALAKLSLGAEGIDKLLPPIYLEGGTKTQVWIPDVYKEVAILIDKSYKDRSVRGVALPKDKMPLLNEALSSVQEMFGELLYSSTGNPPDQAGEVDNDAVAAKDDFIADLDRRLLNDEATEPELLAEISLEKYDQDYKHLTKSNHPRNHAKIFGEMYAIARLASEDKLTVSELSGMVNEDMKVGASTVWNNFSRILTGSAGVSIVNAELPGLQKIHDALLRKNHKVASGKDNNANTLVLTSE